MVNLQLYVFTHPIPCPTALASIVITLENRRNEGYIFRCSIARLAFFCIAAFPIWMIRTRFVQGIKLGAVRGGHTAILGSSGFPRSDAPGNCLR